MTRTVLGHSVQRTEDRRHLDGSAQYVEDVATDLGATWAVFVRSAAAHAELLAVDITDARAAPGVIGVFTATDLDLPPQRAMAGDGKLDRPLLARDRVRFVGEPVAVVVADTRAHAVDAAELVFVESQSLPVVVDAVAGLEPGAPLLFPEFGSNETTGRPAAPRGAHWEAAEVVVRARFHNHRIAPVTMEPNGCVVVPDGADSNAPAGCRCGRARSRCSAYDARSRTCSVSTRTRSSCGPRRSAGASVRRAASTSSSWWSRRSQLGSAGQWPGSRPATRTCST